MFWESKAGDIARLQEVLKLKVVSVGEHYTLERLAKVPPLTIKGRPLLDVTASHTICAEPWVIFEKNQVVFDFRTNKLVPIDSIDIRTRIETGLFWYISGGLILPGSTTDGGQRVKDYSAWFNFGRFSFRYSEVGFV
jgi:hypothetical protein